MQGTFLPAAPPQRAPPASTRRSTPPPPAATDDHNAPPTEPHPATAPPAHEISSGGPQLGLPDWTRHVHPRREKVVDQREVVDAGRGHVARLQKIKRDIEPAVPFFQMEGYYVFVVKTDTVLGTCNDTGFWIVPHCLVNPDHPDLNYCPFPMPKKERRVNKDVRDVTKCYPKNTPNPCYTHPHVDFILPSNNNLVIGEINLRADGEKAEQLDLEFALRMQGLQNCNLRAVWVSVDPDTTDGDRYGLSHSYMEDYVRRFLQHAELNSMERTQQAVDEVIRLFDMFSVQWTLRHRSTLAATIVAASESLVGLFTQSILKPFVEPPISMTWVEISRILRRDKKLGPHFGLCLHYYMTKLEQDRSGRNGNYKSMFNISNSNMFALNSMASFLSSNKEYIMNIVTTNDFHICYKRWTHYLTMDWYSIVTQLKVQPKAYPYKKDFPGMNG